MTTSSEWLPFEDVDSSVEARIDARDRASRERAVDPRYNVALEAAAGTGKTRILVDRYINLLRANVDPANVLAITFTRKAAAEMRERIAMTARTAALCGEISSGRWRELRDRLGDIGICTIDAFCLSLLREFPLEADVDPAFVLADETEVPRLVDEALDHGLRIGRHVARVDENVALCFAHLGERRIRAGLAALLNRRIVAPRVLERYLAAGPTELTIADACHRAAKGMHELLTSVPGGIERFLATGPIEPAFDLLKRDISRLAHERDPAFVQAAFTHIRDHFLTQDGTPRKQLSYLKAQFATDRAFRDHRDTVVAHADQVLQVLTSYRRDLNVIVSRGVWRLFQIAEREYRTTLDAHAVLDFSDVLLRALGLLKQMDEFAQSRYLLESRYHHILMDEFQDTSRAQWELVAMLVKSWGEGCGLAHSGPLQPSIFIVGDRKQSIYGFRDADVSVLEEAGRYLETLRPVTGVRRSISRSFRAVPSLLSFVNDVCADLDKVSSRRDAFRYDEEDRFPVESDAREPSDTLGLIVSETPEVCAALTAAEIARILVDGTVRDRDTGVTRRATPGDIAVLFRTRESHREFENALEQRGIPAYVYKGLGFFDADEIKDALSLLWFLADPVSNLRAAAWLRSRFVGLSDEGLRLLAPKLSEALIASEVPAAAFALGEHDAKMLRVARSAVPRWLALVDRLSPAELIDVVLIESAYTLEMRGPRFRQARENLKKFRGLIRRIQNRGYPTLGRIAGHLDRLSAGDESNAVIDAIDAVNLMTVHASKGLEFPVVFVVNLAKGTANRRSPIRLSDQEPPSVSVGDFQSEADVDAEARDREETKRLLYVAFTRARDRLYLGSVLKEGRLQPARGSLADVLPPTLGSLFAEAAASQEAYVTWRAAGGGTHRFRTCSTTEGPHMAKPRQPDFLADDFALLAGADSIQRTTVEALSAASAGPRMSNPQAETCSDRTVDRFVGIVVHRLLERFGIAQVDSRILSDSIPELIRGDELRGPDELDGVRARALRAYRSVCGRPDLRELQSDARWLHEVPFALRTTDGVVRGSIDCLVRRSDGHTTIIEFKTGTRRSEHRVQLEMYRQAAAQIFGGPVDALLVYAEEA
jgi:ATP-dependent helicase/nuclease subunit A